MKELLSYESYGDAQHKSIVIIHGLFGSNKNWSRISKYLAAHYFVVAVDCRNHGLSFKSPDMDYHLMAADVEVLIESLGLDQPILMGHSMGGKIAMQMVANNENFYAQLVVVDIAPIHYHHQYAELINPLLAIDLVTLKSRKQADKLLSTDISDSFIRLFLLQSLAKSKQGWFWKTDWNSIANNIKKITQAPDLKQINHINSVFIFGDQSDYYSDEAEALIRQHFSHVHILIVKEGNHWLHYQQAEQFIAILEQQLLQ